MSKISSKQYAEILFSLAKQKNDLSNTIMDLETVMEKFNESPSFQMYLEHSKSSLSQKENDLKEIFSDFISQKTYKIILLLIKNKDLDLLGKIIDELEKLKKIDENILEAKIYSTYPLTEIQKAKIKSIMQNKTGKTIILDEILDKNTIGGIKIKIGNTIMDGTIAGRIEKLKQNIAMM